MTCLPTFLSCVLLAAPPETTAPPNVTARVSGKLLNALATQKVERYQPIEEEILGTMYNGHAYLRGQLRVELSPDPSQASLDLVLQGSVPGCSIGWRGNYLAYINSYLPFEVRKRITIDGRQILLYPATARATMLSEIAALSNLRGQTETLRVALARSIAEESKPEVNAISAYRAECRLAEQFDKDSYESPARAARALEAALATVRQAGLSPQPPRWSTTKDHLSVKIAVPVIETIAPQPEAPHDADVVLGIHPSVINQQAEVLLGGKGINIFELGDLLKRFLIPILREGDLDPHLANVEKFNKSYKDLGLPPLLVHFPKRRPVVFAITEDGFSVTLHGIRADGNEASPAADVKVSYRAEKSDDTFIAVRKGNVEVIGDNIFHRTRMQSAFSVFFPARLTLNTIQLPKTMEGERIRLVSSGFILKDGWLLLAWVRKK